AGARGRGPRRARARGAGRIAPQAAVKRRLVETPVLAALVGAFCIAFSGILFRLAHVSPSTGAFFRCLWALPPLWWLARREDRRYGPRSPRVRLYAALAGAFFAVALLAWHHGAAA